MTQEEIIATVGCKSMVEPSLMIYEANVLNYPCSLAFDLRESDTLRYSLFM